MIGATKNFASVAPVVDYTAYATPPFSETSGPAGGLTSNLVTINATGGSGTYTYLWIKLSGGNITIPDDTAKSVGFSASGPNGFEVSAVYNCTVSDGVNPNLSVDVNVNFTFGIPI